MNTLKIQQGNTIETVSSNVIKKLYDAAVSVSEPLEGETDTAYLSGHIQTDFTYESYVNYLAGNIGEGNNGTVTSVRQNLSGRFQGLRIDVVRGYAIPFEDSNMLQYLLGLGVGSNGIITTAQAAAAASNNSQEFINTTNTTVTKFNELKYFTNITGSRNGFSSSGEGYIKFKDWTALEEIDISNFTSIGHSSATFLDTFYGCTSLKIITASNKLKNFGWNSIRDCSNLEDIIDSNGLPALSGTINIYPHVFHGCSKLKNSNFSNCIIQLEGSAGGQFNGCVALTSVSLTGSNIYDSSFKGCSNLTTVNGLSNITSIANNGFYEASLSNVNIQDLSNVETVGLSAFYKSSLSGELNLTKLTTSGLGAGAFDGCLISKVTCLGKSDNIPDRCFKKQNNGDLLTEVYLPYECTSIGGQAFSGRANLTTIKQYTGSVDSWTIDSQTGEKIPSSYGDVSRVTSIGESAFSGCSSLTGGMDFTNITSIDKSAFSGCSNLIQGDLSLPALTNIRERAFQNCSGITSVSNLGQITSLKADSGTQWGIFNNCSNITSITLPTTLREFDFSAICSDGDNINHVPQYIFPYGFEYLIRIPGAQRGKYVRYIQLPSTVTKISCKGACFSVNSNQVDMIIVVQATTVPTTDYTSNGYSFQNGNQEGHPEYCKWYVPDASLNTYKNHADWAPFATSIFPISQLETDSSTYWAIYQANKNYGVPAQ